MLRLTDQRRDDLLLLAPNGFGSTFRRVGGRATGRRDVREVIGEHAVLGASDDRRSLPLRSGRRRRACRLGVGALQLNGGQEVVEEVAAIAELDRAVDGDREGVPFTPAALSESLKVTRRDSAGEARREPRELLGRDLELDGEALGLERVSGGDLRGLRDLRLRDGVAREHIDDDRLAHGTDGDGSGDVVLLAARLREAHEAIVGDLEGDGERGTVPRAAQRDQAVGRDTDAREDLRRPIVEEAVDRGVRGGEVVAADRGRAGVRVQAERGRTGRRRG